MIRLAVLSIAVALLASGCDLFNLKEIDDVGCTGPAPGERDARAQSILAECEKRNSALHTLYAEFVRTSEDAATHAKSTNRGSLRFDWPNRGRVDLFNDEAGKGGLTLLAPNGKRRYQYDLERRRMLVWYSNTAPVFEKDGLTVPTRLSGMLWLTPFSAARINKYFHLSVLRESEREAVLKCRWLDANKTERSMDVVLGKPEWRLKKFVFGDGIRTSTVEFTEIFPNCTLGDKDFEPCHPQSHDKWTVVLNQIRDP